MNDTISMVTNFFGDCADSLARANESQEVQHLRKSIHRNMGMACFLSRAILIYSVASIVFGVFSGGTMGMAVPIIGTVTAFLAYDVSIATGQAHEIASHPRNFAALNLYEPGTGAFQNTLRNIFRSALQETNFLKYVFNYFLPEKDICEIESPAQSLDNNQNLFSSFETPQCDIPTSKTEQQKENDANLEDNAPIFSETENTDFDESSNVEDEENDDRVSSFCFSRKDFPFKQDPFLEEISGMLSNVNISREIFQDGSEFIVVKI